MNKDDLKRKMTSINKRFERQLMDSNNYKIFYWAPDYSFCGFATNKEVRQTAKKWL